VGRASFVDRLLESAVPCLLEPMDMLSPPKPARDRKLDATHRALLARIVETPIPAVHGGDGEPAILIMRLHEKIGLSVSDDTIYRALKDSGFSHVSVRPKAYKQDPRPSRRSKNLPYAWRKSAPASPRAPH
jgi:transposase